MRAFRDRLGRALSENWLLLVVIGGIAIAFLVLRTRASAVGTMAELEVILHDGQPAVVEFFSNT